MTIPPIPSTLGIGIVGLGMIADFHAQAIAQVRGARLIGVASRDAGKARSFASKHHVEFSTNRLKEMLGLHEGRAPALD